MSYFPDQWEHKQIECCEYLLSISACYLILVNHNDEWIEYQLTK